MLSINNPLNLRYSSHIQWQGQQGNCNGFVVFRSMFFGWLAALKNARTKIRRCKSKTITIRDLITIWAPPIENSTENYISFVCQFMNKLGFSVSDDTFFGEPENTESSKKFWISFFSAMYQVENGVPLASNSFVSLIDALDTLVSIYK